VCHDRRYGGGTDDRQSFTSKIRAWRARFDAAHADAVAALQRHDYEALGVAVRNEAQMIREYGELIAEHQMQLAKLRERVMLDQFIGDESWATE
jgi:hypothetical protein